MKVLLTGASGTIGAEIFKQLVLTGQIELIVFDINTKRSRLLFEPFRKYIQLIFGSLTNETDISKIPPDIDAAIHLAALIPPVSDKKPNLTRRINIDGTKNLIHHLEITSPQAIFLYSSSVSVYGDRLKNPEINVTDAIKPGADDVYGQSKAKAERIIQESKLDWTIFRLAAIMKNHKISKLMFHMPLATELEICTPEDTARAFINALYHRDELKNKIFNLGGGVNCRINYKGFLNRSFEMFGLGKLNFPNRAFADYNYHCGIFTDGDDLENILHFRKDNLERYFGITQLSIKPIIHLAGSVFRPFIKLGLLLSSEPFRARLTHNQKMKSRFFDKKI